MPLRAADLPFHEAEYLGRLREWVLIESPTFDAAAVERVLDRAAGDLADLGAAVSVSRAAPASLARVWRDCPTPAPGSPASW